MDVSTEIIVGWAISIVSGIVIGVIANRVDSGIIGLGKKRKQKRKQRRIQLERKIDEKASHLSELPNLGVTFVANVITSSIALILSGGIFIGALYLCFELTSSALNDPAQENDWVYLIPLIFWLVYIGRLVLRDGGRVRFYISVAQKLEDNLMREILVEKEEDKPSE